MRTQSRPGIRQRWMSAWDATWRAPRQRGAAGPLGLVAVFIACAVVLTIIMLFATGVAQRGILPRLRNRAATAVSVEEAPATAAGARAGASATFEVGSAPAAIDSLRALKQQVRIEQQRLQERIDRMSEATSQMKEARGIADEDAQKRTADLAKIYSSMKPQSAAMVMVNLDDVTFQKVLAKLNTRQAAKILSFVDPVRVARLTEEQTTPASEKNTPGRGER